MVTRAARFLRWPGSKYRLAPTIVGLLPDHRAYVEVFGGAACVLFLKERSRYEVFNDIDGNVVNFFRVLRSPGRCRRLADLVARTPYSRAEFERAVGCMGELSRLGPTRRAYAFLILCNMAITGTEGNLRTLAPSAFQSEPDRARDGLRIWRNLPLTIVAAAERLRGVLIEGQDWRRILDRFDRRGVLFYVDPPYLSRHLSRRRSLYTYSMSGVEHVELLERLRACEGKVVVSGFSSLVYERHLRDWARYEFSERNSRGGRTVEVVWCNYEPEGGCLV